MNRNHIFNRPCNLTHQEASRKVAIHEAGHAAAIYFGNKHKGLPPVFFQIVITSLKNGFQSTGFTDQSDYNAIAKIEGGRLIPMLPSSVEEATSGFSSAQKLAYKRALEADMMNILVGPLAEAKYIALRDDELINSRLVNLNALQYYGGITDLENVNEYLECLIGNAELREPKIMELFLAAFSFVNEGSNWRAITALADYILAVLTDNKSVIEYDDIIGVLETGRHWVNQRAS